MKMKLSHIHLIGSRRLVAWLGSVLHGFEHEFSELSDFLDFRPKIFNIFEKSNWIERVRGQAVLTSH